MNRNYDSWREDRRDLNRGFRLGLGWWVIIVIVALLIGAWIWGLTVATSGVRGQGDGIIRKNSADNWISAQRAFEQNYADYESTLTRIDTFHAAYEADQSDAVAKTNWLGSISYCTELVADYNADARSYLSEDFQASDLPYQLDPTTCTTTQENTP